MRKISVDPMDLFLYSICITGLKSGSTISAEPMALYKQSLMKNKSNTYKVLKTLQEANKATI